MQLINYLFGLNFVQARRGRVCLSNDFLFMLESLLLGDGYLVNWLGDGLALRKLIQCQLLVLLEDRDATKRPDTIRDYIHDVSLSIIEFIFLYVEVEVEHVDKGIGH